MQGDPQKYIYNGGPALGGPLTGGLVMFLNFSGKKKKEIINQFIKLELG